jgi:3-dehydroquinate dehydratase/shikimate dehydrogenase
MADLLAARDRSSAADMIELRLDGIADADTARALDGRRRPVIVTCRPVWEGGCFDGSEEERARLLADALEGGAEFVDVEWRALTGTHAALFQAMVRQAPARVVLSMHDFEGIPADLEDRARAMRTIGAGVVKIAVAASRLRDSLPLREIARPGDAVVIAMGDRGFPSRLLAAKYGSRWTYAGSGLAPGQVPASRMIDELGFRRIAQSTRLFGVVSTNAMHSLSPAMHNAAFEAAGLDCAYVPLSTGAFDDFLAYAEAMTIEGASVTIPFKLDALRAAARADGRARAAGAANTLRRVPATPVEAGPAEAGHDVPGVWEATNTDVDGFLAPLDAAFPRSLEGVHAAVLGAGGSARAVVVALVSRGARVTVHARRPEQAREVAAATGAGAGAWPPPPGSWDVLVNCTPLGGAGRRTDSPLPGGPFTGPVVYDLTYGSGRSRLLSEAAAAGCVTLDGLPMLVAQAERQFEWWTGQRPQRGVMAEAVRRHLSGSTAAVEKVQ